MTRHTLLTTNGLSPYRQFNLLNYWTCGLTALQLDRRQSCDGGGGEDSPTTGILGATSATLFGVLQNHLLQVPKGKMHYYIWLEKAKYQNHVCHAI
jgi:hypothetical protein